MPIPENAIEIKGFEANLLLTMPDIVQEICLATLNGLTGSPIDAAKEIANKKNADAITMFAVSIVLLKITTFQHFASSSHTHYALFHDEESKMLYIAEAEKPNESHKPAAPAHLPTTSLTEIGAAVAGD